MMVMDSTVHARIVTPFTHILRGSPGEGTQSKLSSRRLIELVIPLVPLDALLLPLVILHVCTCMQTHTHTQSLKSIYTHTTVNTQPTVDLTFESGAFPVNSLHFECNCKSIKWKSVSSTPPHHLAYPCVMCILLAKTIRLPMPSPSSKGQGSFSGCQGRQLASYLLVHVVKKRAFKSLPLLCSERQAAGERGGPQMALPLELWAGLCDLHSNASFCTRRGCDWHRLRGTSTAGASVVTNRST